MHPCDEIEGRREKYTKIYIIITEKLVVRSDTTNDMAEIAVLSSKFNDVTVYFWKVP